MERNDGRGKWCVMPVLLLALGVRLLYLSRAVDYPNFLLPYAGLDVAMYHGLAQRVAAGDLRLGTDVYYFSPLFAYFLGGLYSIFGNGAVVVRGANLLLGCATIGLVFAFTKAFFCRSRAGLVAAAGAALYGPYLVFDTSGLETSLGLFLLALSLFLMTRPDFSRKLRSLLAVGFCLGLAAAVDGQTVFFLGGIVAWFLLGEVAETGPPTPTFRKRLGQCAEKVLFLLLGAVLAVAPFTLRNWLVAGEWVTVSSVGGIHTYIGNHVGAWGGYTAVPGIRPNSLGHKDDARRLAERQAGKTLAASEVSAYWRGMAFDFIRGRSYQYFRLCWRKLLLFCAAYEIPSDENYQYLTWISPYLALFPGYGILFATGGTGMVFAVGRWRRLLPLYLLVGSSLLASLLTFVTWRYRLPATLALWAFTGNLANSMACWLQNRRYLLLSTASLLFVFLFFLSQVRILPPRLSAEHMKKAESKMSACRREAEIKMKIAEVAPWDQRSISRLWLEVAQVRNAQNDLEGALAAVEEGLFRLPGDRRLLAMEGNLWRRLGPREKELTLHRQRLQTRQPGEPKRRFFTPKPADEIKKDALNGS